MTAGNRNRFILYLTLPIIVLVLLGLWNVRESLRESTLLHLKGHMLELAQHYAGEVARQLDQGANIATTTANLLGIAPSTMGDEALYQILASNIGQNDIIFGAAIAFDPQSSDRRELFSPYVYRNLEGMARMDIAAEAYNYTDPQWEWWHAPKQEGQGIWTDPYFDEGAGNILMVTYSVPFFKGDRFQGVTTVDIDLKAMHANLNLEGLKKTDYVILSNTGHFAFHYKPDLVGKSYLDMAGQLKNTEAQYLANQMLAGERGLFEIKRDNGFNWVFYAPVGSYGWSFALRMDAAQVEAAANFQFSNFLRWSLGLSVLILGLTYWLSGRFIQGPQA